MGVINLAPYKPVPGTVGDANAVSNAFTALETVLNGGIDNNNFAAGLIFNPVKIMQGGATLGQALAWDGAAYNPASVSRSKYRKATAKVVANTVAETDLLNGEITIAANEIGANGVLRLTAGGDWINNSGGAANLPRFKLKLGGVTILDTGTVGAFMSAAATRWGWEIQCLIRNLGAANVQWASLNMDGSSVNAVGVGLTNFAVGEGNYVVYSQAAGFSLCKAYGGNGAAVDTTAAKLLELTVINGVANAAYDVTLKSGLVELL